VGGVRFVVDEKGHHTAVIIDLKTHESLWEDIYDAFLAHKRSRDTRETLATVKKSLIQKTHRVHD
jgi:PHD/YefM family antitoxin component YafN of YafNO toxin-antitoxin module